MNKLQKSWIVFRSIATYVVAALLGIIFFVPCLLIAILLPERHRFTSKLLYALLNISYRAVTWATFLKIHVKGLENIPEGPIIIIANHESALDIPLLGMIMGSRPHLWYVYYIFFNLPVMGRFINKMAMPVYLDEPIRSGRSMARGICLAKCYNLSSIIFPEGGRYVDGKIHDFFAGFVMIARKVQQPIVPVMLRNVGKVYPPNSLLLYPSIIEVEVGKPLVVGQQETNEQFAQRSRDWFVERN